MLDDQALLTTETFTYLGSVVRQDGGTNKDIQSRLSKARNAFRSLKALWRSSQYSIKTQLKLYQRSVLSTLLYGSKCWRTTKHDLAKTSSFLTTNLRKIQRIFWPRTISIRDLLARCQQEDMETIITRKRWRWIGHVLHKGCQLHHQSCNPLDPRGKAEAWSTEDNLAK